GDLHLPGLRPQNRQPDPGRVGRVPGRREGIRLIRPAGVALRIRMLVSLATLRSRLVPDLMRVESGFLPDIEKANEVLLNPMAQDSERQQAMDLWLLGRHAQPCVFGKIAAGQRRMFYCFITGDDIARSDDHVQEKVAAARRLWKLRAL